MVRGATPRKQPRAKGTKKVRRPSVRAWRRLFSVTASACAVVALLGLLAIGGWRLMSMPVERVIVSGDLQQVSREELMAVVSESIEGGFLWTDLNTIREPLESMPWVYRVVVRRQWPDSLEVQVIEQRVIARWGDEAYLNHAGEVFTPDRAVALQGLPLLAGPKGSEAELMVNYQLVHERLQPLGLQVSELAMDARGGLTAQLLDGGELVFGRDDLAIKLQRFQAVYRAQLAARMQDVRRVDLRYSHGAAVAWAVPNNHKTEQKT